MKHLQIFEDFSMKPINENITRYDYGMYTDNYDINTFYEMTEKEKYPFTEEESDILWNILNGNVELLDIIKESGSVYFEYNNLIYTVKNLGDYCYGIFIDRGGNGYGDDLEWESCELFDGMEDLCEKLKTMK